jgi:hypothetical protein
MTIMIRVAFSIVMRMLLETPVKEIVLIVGDW